jgi:hypothetical protein
MELPPQHLAVAFMKTFLCLCISICQICVLFYRSVLWGSLSFFHWEVCLCETCSAVISAYLGPTPLSSPSVLAFLGYPTGIGRIGTCPSLQQALP